MSEQPSNVHTNHGGNLYIPEAAIRAINPMLDVASAETMLEAAYPHLRRAIIEELIAKAENGPADGANDPHAAYWLRAELDGEG